MVVNRMTAFENEAARPASPREMSNRPAGEPRVPREHIVPAVGRRLIVRCDQPNCDRAAIIDPRKVFGSAKDWPVRGASDRFRCLCGSRRSLIDYTHNADVQDGPIDRASLALWF